LGVHRVEDERLLVGGDRPVHLALRRPRVAQPDVGVGVERAQLDRLGVASTAWSKRRRGAARNRSPSALYGSGYAASSWVDARNCAAAFQRLPSAWWTAPRV